jgi:hypothetical protein
LSGIATLHPKQTIEYPPKHRLTSSRTFSLGLGHVHRAFHAPFLAHEGHPGHLSRDPSPYGPCSWVSARRRSRVCPGEANRAVSVLATAQISRRISVQTRIKYRIVLPRMFMLSSGTASCPLAVILTLRSAVFICGDTLVIVPCTTVPTTLRQSSSNEIQTVKLQPTILKLDRNRFVRALHQEPISRQTMHISVLPLFQDSASSSAIPLPTLWNDDGELSMR